MLLIVVLIRQGFKAVLNLYVLSLCELKGNRKVFKASSHGMLDLIKVQLLALVYGLTKSIDGKVGPFETCLFFLINLNIPSALDMLLVQVKILENT